MSVEGKEMWWLVHKLRWELQSPNRISSPSCNLVHPKVHPAIHRESILYILHSFLACTPSRPGTIIPCLEGHYSLASLRSSLRRLLAGRKLEIWDSELVAMPRLSVRAHQIQ